MTDKLSLLTRLDEIGASLERSGKALALIGLGSVGLEMERLDDYSDLDFFAIVEPGYKGAFIDNLDWLSSICPLAYCFRNTPDGYKLLFQDGIFCEFAVFEPGELPSIPFAPGRIVWKRAGVEESIAIPVKAPPAARQSDPEWLLGEALTNLYVGLCRYQRGEKLSAQRFIQQYAVDRLLELAEHTGERPVTPGDPFTPERRFEQRFPGLAEELPHFVQGYERSRESARAILAYLEEHFPVNPAMRDAILELCR
jgi:hypothetical protein